MTDHDHAPPGDPSYAGFRIAELWAWTMVDPEDDQEGIVVMPTTDGPFPLIASDRVRLEDLAEWARVAADRNGRPAQLRHFTLSLPDPVAVLLPRLP